jgi:uncharacterized membrane protein YccC
MIYPSRKDWLFSVKTFIAAMIALYLALYFQLPRPYWAMASVYVVSNPFVGATRSKALYRALGTMLGASAAIFFVPPLVGMPLVLCLVVALWTGTLLLLSLTDRTARSYVFLLAGYTLPLIAFPTVNDPTTVFDVATARTQEILLGIICASVVNSTLFPNKLGPALAERTFGWFADASQYVRETFSGRLIGKDLSATRQRLAVSVNGLEFLLKQLAYDDTKPDMIRRAHALRGRMSLLLPMSSSVSDPLAALRAHGAVPAEIELLLSDITEWVASKDGVLRESQANALRARIDALEPSHVRVPDNAADDRAAASAVAPTALTNSDDQDDQDDQDKQNTQNNPARSAGHSESITQQLREQGDQENPAVKDIAADPYINPLWDRALISSLLGRLRLMVDMWQDCRTLRELIDKDPQRAWVPQLRHWRLGGVDRHIDWPMLLLSVVPAVSVTFIASCIWIFTGWQDGASAVTLAAVSCSFFASLDAPAPQIWGFFVWTLVSTLLAGLYLFAVLPNVHEFGMLVILLAGPFIIAGGFIPQPRFTLASMLTAVNTATFLSLQGAYDANFLTFVNSNLSGCVGLLFAFLFMRVCRPFGAEVAAARLTRSGWADVVIAASPHAIAMQTNMASRMLDRLMQLLPRLSPSDDDHHPSIESFRDLRVGLNALDLQQIRRTLTEELRRPIDAVLAGIRQYFQQCIEQRKRLPPPPELAARIDAALALNIGSIGTTDNEGIGTMDNEGLGTMQARVGLRLSLFPVPLTLSNNAGGNTVKANDAASAKESRE